MGNGHIEFLSYLGHLLVPLVYHLLALNSTLNFQNPLLRPKMEFLTTLTWALDTLES